VAAFERKDAPALVNMLKEEAAADHLGPLTYAVGAVYRQNPGGCCLPMCLVSPCVMPSVRQGIAACCARRSGGFTDTSARDHCCCYSVRKKFGETEVAKLEPLQPCRP
jgi:hypothetical protein